MKDIDKYWRILFVESYPHVIFGQQKTMLTLLQKCQGTQIEAIAGVTAEGPFVKTVRQLGLEIIFFNYPKLLANYGGAIYRYQGLRKLSFGWQVLKYIYAIRQQLQEQKIQAVFCNDMRGLLTVGIAARSCNIPVMIWDKLDRPHGWLDYLQLPLTNTIAFISESVKTKFPTWQLRRYHQKLHTVPNGANIVQFDMTPPIKRQALGIEEQDIVFAIVGSITPRKGQDRLLTLVPRLVKQIPHAKIMIIGAEAGSEEDKIYLENLPNRQHPNVHFLGLRQDVPAIMHTIDALIIPSRYEGMGQVIAEAMACRKPVVGARAGGIQEVIVDGETGFLFEGDNSEQLLMALVKLGHSSELRTKMGEAGRQRVEKFYDRSVQMDKIIALLTTMVNK